MGRKIDIGKIAITPEGEWLADRNYEYLSFVQHNGSGYLSLQDNENVEPGTDENVWMLASKGGTPELTSDEDGNIYADGKLLSSTIAEAKALNDRIASEEQERANAEQTRVASENIRIESEGQRINAETGRKSAESSRVSNEESRKRFETQRISAETERRLAENNRVENEAARLSAENQRISAERARVTNENARIVNERNRQDAEAARAAALANKQDVLVSGENIKTLNGKSLLGEGNIDVGDEGAVRFVSQNLTNEQKAQARTNIEAYKKPASGIPASDIASDVIQGISNKQDAISDLSDIRSGAALGSTSIQPSDIEDMVEAEPIGSIIPPVNPSEFATKEEVNQLGQELDEVMGGVVDISLDLSDSDLWVFGDVNSSTGAVTNSSVRTITKRIKQPSGTISADYTNSPNRVVSVVFLYDSSETYLGHDEAAGNRASFNFDQLKQNYPQMDSIIICQYFRDYNPAITEADDIVETINFSGAATQKVVGEGWKSQIDANMEFSEYAKPIVDSLVLKDSPNLFNPNNPDVAIGYYIYTSYLEQGSSYNTSGYIPVLPNTTYYKSQECREFRFVSYFGTNKDYLSNEANKNSFTTPADCYFVRVSFYANVYDYAQVASQDIPFVPFGKSLCLSGEMGITDDSVATKKYVDDSSGSGSNDFLAGKKWCPLGDSFTEGVTNTTISDGVYAGERKVYPFFIGNRTGINVVKTFFSGGRTLAFPATPGDFTNSICNPSAACYYQNIPEDVDYITIYLGINDSHHAPGSSGGDGEDNTGIIPIGTIDDAVTSTYYGAWNVVLSWLIENRPFAHIGIIVSNGCDTAEYRTAQIAIARKYGIPFIDLNGDERTPFMIRSKNEDIAATIRQKRTISQSVDYPNNQHPNGDAHLFESYFIESWLRTI